MHSWHIMRITWVSEASGFARNHIDFNIPFNRLILLNFLSYLRLLVKLYTQGSFLEILIIFVELGIFARNRREKSLLGRPSP